MMNIFLEKMMNFLSDEIKEIDFFYQEEFEYIYFHNSEEEKFYGYEIENHIFISNEFLYIYSFSENEEYSIEENSIELLKINLFQFENENLYYFEIISKFIKDRIEYIKNLQNSSKEEKLEIDLEKLEIRRKNFNRYDDFFEIKISDNEFIFLNDYIYDLEEFENNEEIDIDIIEENFIILKKSIIDEIENLSDDDFQNLIKNFIIDDYEKKFSNRKILNQYIRFINEILESKRNEKFF